MSVNFDAPRLRDLIKSKWTQNLISFRLGFVETIELTSA